MIVYYKAYATYDPLIAIDLYLKKTDNEPTIIIARPNVDLVNSHPLLVRSRFGIATGLLLSHLISPDEFDDKKSLPISQRSIDEFDVTRKSSLVIKKRGRPKKSGGKCPHCRQVISDFNWLGWWWGWQYGLEPPYWEELRSYVLRRDRFQCKDCKQTFGMSGLVAHHLDPKENQGPDAAWNLATVCHECHPDSKPIYADVDVR